MQNFDYETTTRRHYQNVDKARRYHSKYTGHSFKHLRSRFVARQERRMLRAMLAPYMPRVVLDVPCGTGKMAPVLAGFGATVIAADISDQMIAYARAEYARLGHSAVEFVTCDAESIAGILDGRHVDAACCIRLLHRVPEEPRRRILSELAKTAPVVVVSYGVTSPVQRLRGRLLRKKGKMADRLYRQRIEAELGEEFTLVAARPIARVLCSEWFFLARRPAAP